MGQRWRAAAQPHFNAPFASRGIPPPFSSRPAAPSAQLHSANWVLLRNTAECRRKRAPKEVRRPPPSVRVLPSRSRCGPSWNLEGERGREGPRGMCERREGTEERPPIQPSQSPFSLPSSAHFSMVPSAAFRQRENNSSPSDGRGTYK